MTSKDPEIHFNNEGPVSKKGQIRGPTHPGILGNFFGGADNAPTSICGIVVILLIINGTLITLVDTKVELVNFSSYAHSPARSCHLDLQQILLLKPWSLNYFLNTT